MADREAQQKLYAYSEMSNKVQQADRSQRRSRGDGTGEVESLRGRNDSGRMGDRVSSIQKTTRPAELEDMMEKAKKKRQKRDGGAGDGGHVKKQNILMSSGGQSILDLGELNSYQPTHAGSRASYEGLLVSNQQMQHSFRQSLSHSSACMYHPCPNIISFARLDRT